MRRKTTTTRTGAAIRYGRDLLGLTREELAERMGDGWTPMKLANYELGRTDPTLSQAVELADALRLPLRVIAYGIDGPTPEGSGGTTRYYEGAADLLELDLSTATSDADELLAV